LNEIQEMIAARDEYIELIKSELLGPGSEFNWPDKEHELISSNPLNRYSVGILYPQGVYMRQDNDEAYPVTSEDEAEEANTDETISFTDEDGSIRNESNSKEETASSLAKGMRTYEYDETASENLDEEVNLATQYMPSSMGISFIIKGKANKISCDISFATYRKARFQDCAVPFIPQSHGTYQVPAALAHKITYDERLNVIRLLSPITLKEAKEIKDRIPENEFNVIGKIIYRFVDYCRTGYVRQPHANLSTLEFSSGDYTEVNYNIDDIPVKITALRKKISDDLWFITVMLVNGHTFDRNEKIPDVSKCIFQPEIKVFSSNNEFVFVENTPNNNFEYMDEEERSLDLLYRNKKIYGTGLGVAVNWDIDENGAGAIWSDYFPWVEVPQMSFNLPNEDFITSDKLSMRYLSDLDETEKVQKLADLKGLVDQYKSWVEGLESAAVTLDSRYRSTAAKNIEECKRAYQRMYSGLKTLEKNENAYFAFCLANRAMFMQRVHLRMQRKTLDIERYPDDSTIADLLQNMDYRKESDEDARWRPFQIAFILMDIDSIVNDSSPEREIVDLIWFPTGGGKTEAYLGLTAFTIFYRRLAYPAKSGGTTVIMRYTLRLLAAQQFTRASTLICACEFIRQDSAAKRPVYPSYPLGNEPITIGLWVGGTHIPNKNNGARECLEKLLPATSRSLRYIKEKYNKFQVLKCPWCGTKLVRDVKNGRLVGSWGYSMKDDKHFYMFCPQDKCTFRRRLPIQIIDEELYENPPTMLFGTVDKFAMLPWDGRTGSFFAINSDNRSPELIIQDELHLISGALGTIVGLYETAVDYICGQKGVKPKIIASTATIRRAKEQCSALYNREVVQFPSPGLDSHDSFFAREGEISYDKGRFGRIYVGIMPSGKTKAMIEIRAMAAMLQSVHMMNLPDKVKDKFWTLTVYFNSLKDLGKASTLVDDDVKDFIIRIANRMLSSRRLIVGLDELTSRVTTTELNETLDKLEKIEYSEENIEAKRRASNILLATNMISVGIDVARLNTMLMVGQPKLTSEYIQASSRVGRSFPGVVFVLFDATKSRDRSHYEQFKSYHESFYRFVEPTGATPFSRPARERALHAVLTAMFRQRSGLSADNDAANFDKECFAKYIEEIKRFIIKRVQDIHERTDSKLNPDVNGIEKEIDAFFDKWQRIVDECKKPGEPTVPLSFGRKYMMSFPSSCEKRLLKPYNSIGNDYAFNTLTSMRNVDAQVTGKVVVWEE